MPIQATIRLRAAAGNDTLNGDAGNDAINGSDGNDTIKGGQGTDSLAGGIGYDTFLIQQISDISGFAENINGGSDIDTLDFSSLGAFGAVNLVPVIFTSVEQLKLGNNDATLTAAQLTAFDEFIGTFGTERLIMSGAGTADFTNANISNIDEICGTAGNDTVILTGVATGQSVNTLGGNDSITGGNGGDGLNGGTGNDTIGGGSGNDSITGGLGTDTLTGDTGIAGNDTFRYVDASESLAGAGRDVITDFVHGQDIIDLSGVDSNSNVAGNQSFTFIDTAAFSSVAGQLRHSSANGRVQGDIDGNATSDFEILLSNLPATISGADIIL